MIGVAMRHQNMSHVAPLSADGFDCLDNHIRTVGNASINQYQLIRINQKSVNPTKSYCVQPRNYLFYTHCLLLSRNLTPFQYSYLWRYRMGTPPN